ncbi:hypothetical protein quinque_010029 [Culex quinquefasciatus]
MCRHSRRSDRSPKTVAVVRALLKFNFPARIMKHVVLVMSMLVVLVSGGLAPVKRRDLRYRPNNSIAYQYTSVHSGIEGEVAKAVSYQHRLEQIHAVTRVVPTTKPAPTAVATSQARVIPAAPVAVAVVAVKAARGPQQAGSKPRFPTRQAIGNTNGNGGSPSAIDRRRTTVDITSGNLQRHHQKAAVAHSHAQVQQYHEH